MADAEPGFQFSMSCLIIGVLFQTVIKKESKYPLSDFIKLLDIYSEYIKRQDPTDITFEQNVLFAEAISNFLPLLNEGSILAKKCGAKLVAKYLETAIVNQSIWTSKYQHTEFFLKNSLLLKELNSLCVELWGKDPDKQTLFYHLIQQNSLELITNEDPNLHFFYIFEALLSRKLSAIGLSDFFTVFRQSLRQLVENLLPRGVSLNTSSLAFVIKKFEPFIFNEADCKNILSSVSLLVTILEQQNDQSFESILTSFSTNCLMLPRDKKVYFFITILHTLTSSSTHWKMGLNLIKNPQVSGFLNPDDVEKLKQNAKSSVTRAIQKSKALTQEDILHIKVELEILINFISMITSWKVDERFNLQENVLLPIDDILKVTKSLLATSGNFFDKTFENSLKHYIDVIFGLKELINGTELYIRAIQDKYQINIPQVLIESKDGLLDAILKLCNKERLTNQYSTKHEYFNDKLLLIKEALTERLRSYYPDIEPLNITMLLPP